MKKYNLINTNTGKAPEGILNGMENEVMATEAEVMAFNREMKQGGWALQYIPEGVTFIPDVSNFDRERTRANEDGEEY